MEKLAPGRLAQVRGGSAKEYAATTVLRIALDECAVKQRKGGPLDDAGDMAHVVWTGELPFTHGRGAAIADALNTSDAARVCRRMGYGIRLTGQRACPMIGVDGDRHQSTHS